MKFQRAIFPIEIAADPAADQGADQFTVRVTASSPTADRLGRIAIQDFDLSNFERNPVVLWNHGISADPNAEFPVGRASNWAYEDGKLAMDIAVATPKANPICEKLRAQLKERTINAVSIGWMPGEVTALEDGTLVLSGNELREISFCAIGANPDALVQNASAFAEIRNGAINKRETQMKKVATALGLQESATEVEIAAAATAAIESQRDLRIEIAALKSKADRFDEVSAKLAKIESDRLSERRAAIVAKGQKEGKITPANLASLYEVCGGDAQGNGVDVERFGKLVDMLTPAVNTAHAVTPAAASASRLDPDVVAQLARWGLTAEEVEAQAAKQGFNSKGE